MRQYFFTDGFPKDIEPIENSLLLAFALVKLLISRQAAFSLVD